MSDEPPESRAGSLNPRQCAVAEWLEEQKPELGSTYRVARALLAETPDPGHERTRVLLICHAMREVINRLPTAVMLGRGSLDRRVVANHKGSSDSVRRLPKLRVDYPDMDLALDAENVPVPREVALAFDSLIDAAVYEDQRRLSDLAAFLTDDANPTHPAVREWRGLSKYFSTWGHLHDKRDESVPSDLELVDKVRVFEDHVDAIRLAFFASKSVVEDLLAAANQPLEEGQP